MTARPRTNFAAFPVTVPLALREQYPRHRAVKDHIDGHRYGGRAPVRIAPDNEVS